MPKGHYTKREGVHYGRPRKKVEEKKEEVNPSLVQDGVVNNNPTQ